MTKRPRRNHRLAFKANVARVAIKGDKTLTELAQQFDVHANQITNRAATCWRVRRQSSVKARRRRLLR